VLAHCGSLLRPAAYSSGLWGTYRQWASLGAQVCKGEHGTTVVFWKQAASRAEDDRDDGRGRSWPHVRARVHGVQPCPGRRDTKPEPVAQLPESERFGHADAFVEALKIPITEGAYDAHYRIDLDRIFMPDLRLVFAMHRRTWARCCTRRPTPQGPSTGSTATSRSVSSVTVLAIEEICAELTASFVLADLGIAHHPRPDHAAYVASWLRALKDDPRAIFTAASKAQAAADWMHAQQPQSEEIAA
jgi:antirestriction protein ArdC